MKDFTDQIWAYLHNELSPEQRVKFDEELEKNSGLRERLEERQVTHQELNDLFLSANNEERCDDQMVEQLLYEWEEEHSHFAESLPKNLQHNIIRFILPLAAAAAVVAVLVALPLEKGSIHWERTTYGETPQVRGQTDIAPQYSRSELKREILELQSCTETALTALSESP